MLSLMYFGFDIVEEVGFGIIVDIFGFDIVEEGEPTVKLHFMGSAAESRGLTQLLIKIIKINQYIDRKGSIGKTSVENKLKTFLSLHKMLKT